MRRFPFFIAAFSLLSLSACPNIFAPLDSPSGDAQILSAARACFDKGDYECAAEHYAKLGNLDAAIAENALLALERKGLGIGPIARAISSADGSLGSILTELTEAAAPAVASEGANVRLDIADAYKKVAQLDSQELKGFVRFMTNLALAATVLAEHSGISSDGVFSKTDIADAACSTNDAPGCASCGAGFPGGFTDDDGEGTTQDYIDNAGSTTAMNGNPSWNKFWLAIFAASQGLTEMAVSSGSSLDLIEEIKNAGFTPTQPCFRAAMLAIPGFGR